MKEDEIIKHMAEVAGISRKEAGVTLKALTSILLYEVEHGGKVRISGIGTFAMKDRPARTGRNPQTGELLAIAATRVLTFKPTKSTKGEQ